MCRYVKIVVWGGKLVKESYPWVEKQVVQEPIIFMVSKWAYQLWKEFQAIILEGYGDVMARLRGRFAYPLVYELPAVTLRDVDVAYGGVDDMKRLGCLNKPAVPYILKKSYDLHEICTIFMTMKRMGHTSTMGSKRKEARIEISTKNVVLDDDDCELIKESNLAFRRPMHKRN
ncbi:hypothetical protein Tco_0214936 [Tanacetum coccineum]